MLSLQYLFHFYVATALVFSIALAYVIRLCRTGNYTFRGGALPMLFQPLYEATKQVGLQFVYTYRRHIVDAIAE